MISPTESIGEAPVKTQAPSLSEAVFHPEFVAFITLMIFLAVALIVYSVANSLRLKNSAGNNNNIKSSYTATTMDC